MLIESVILPIISSIILPIRLFSRRLYHNRFADRAVGNDTLGSMMTYVQGRRQVMTLATLTTVVGALLLVYLFWAVPPWLPNGDTSNAALLLLFLGLLTLVFGLGSLVALALHRRWPALAGVRDARRRADPWVATRQGVLLAIAVGVMLLLTLLRMLDVAFALVTLVLAGLIEGFFQNRRPR